MLVEDWLLLFDAVKDRLRETAVRARIEMPASPGPAGQAVAQAILECVAALEQLQAVHECEGFSTDAALRSAASRPLRCDGGAACCG